MGPDFSELLAAVDFGDVGTAILGLAALMAVPIVVSWGAKRVMAFVDGRDDDEAERERWEAENAASRW